MKRSTLSAAVALSASLIVPGIAQDEKKAEAKPATEEAKPAAAEKASEPKILVKVDDVNITEADVEKRLLAMYGPRLAQMPADQAEQMRAHAMPSIKEELIAKTLLLAAAAKADIKVDEKKHAEMMEQVAASIPEGSTKEEFFASLKMDEASFKEAMGEEVRINTLLDQKTADVAAPTEEETKKFYDDNEQQFNVPASVEASHILIKTEGITDEAEKAKKKAELEAIRKQLIEKKGENFKELAEAHSACPSGKQSGGSLGDFGPGQMVPEFDAAAFSQKVGEIGEIVETNFGYHVIRVDDKTEAGKTAYDEIKERISEHLKQEKQGNVVREYISELRKAAKIEDLSAPAVDPNAPAPATPAPAAG